ncbi:MAG: hypothetical protein IPF51_13330 [Dehalococcoidia bacterium]|jgi:hypothetical protein|uniref:hypothetical protein n=1 Tax=Candidatus Amarobacter glycogenicus TaxID=3140699 RepID=UPI0031371181|nr:hypothetical protein [Dehalococcoidia bacterium]MCC6269267.1 hypothetical protein [Dehalococcoidia bacterium]
MTIYDNFYVYAPVSGQITALDYYCGDGYHPRNYGNVSPIDIGGGGGGSLIFKASSNVKSIHIGHWSLCSGYGSPWSDGVYVELYSAEGTPYWAKFGAVYYGHVANRAAESWPNYNGSSVTLGTVPSSCPCGVCYNPCCEGDDCWCTPICDPCNCCYQGAHSHFELRNDSPVSSVNPNLYCGKQMYAGDSSSWVYKWQVAIG